MAALNQTDRNEPGHQYNFRTPLPPGEYFAITPTYRPPHNAQPIIDDQTGVCIGYSVAQAPGLWQIYDADGRFAILEEVPLETPLIDPTDIALFMFGAFRLLRTGVGLFESGISNKVKAVLSGGALNILKGRFKAGLSVRNLLFTQATARHMADPGRYIPVHILEKAVRFGRRGPDPQKIPGQFEYIIGMTRLTKRVEGNAIVYRPKKYTLQVIIREKDWTVMHYHIEAVR